MAGTLENAVAVIETTSNQSFIFGTNRLREAVGASEMVYAAGVDLVLEALGYCAAEIGQARKPERKDGGKGGCAQQGLRPFLVERNGVQPLLIASGKAILLGPEEKLKEIIRKVTLAAAERMPGLGVLGGIAGLEGDADGAEALHDAIRRAHERLAALRARVPSAHLRFQRLPFVAECASSGLPAHGVDSKAPERDVISEPVCAKRKFQEKGKDRLREWLEQENLAGSIDDIDKVLREAEGRWVAVIHADGNGLGEIFLDFLNRCNAQSREDYIQKYQAFSLALDTCTINAAKGALAEIFAQQEQTGQKGRRLPFIPLIIGGDDLTVICDGAHAVPFAARFLQYFEEETGRHDDIKAISPNGLTAAAGIAIVKPHFPFFRAYELAESLLKSAKQVKRKAKEQEKKGKGASALHYHVHFDSSGADWGRIRQQLDVGDEAILSMQPWVATAGGDTDWAAKRRIAQLWQAMHALRQRDDEGRLKLPRSQQHALREALFRGREIAEGHLKRIEQRYGKVWEELLPQTYGKSLFFQESENGKDVWRTPLLDVMDLADVCADLSDQMLTALAGTTTKEEESPVREGD